MPALLKSMFSIGPLWLATLAMFGAAAMCAAVGVSRGRIDRAALILTAAIVAATGAAAVASHSLYKAYLRRLGRNLPHVSLLEPKAKAVLGRTIALRAHATDKPGELGPIAAVRRVEFWLYHPSFIEQHAGNHESKILLGEVDGPSASDEYAITWPCRNPFTPARDGDHGIDADLPVRPTTTARRKLTSLEPDLAIPLI